MTAGDAFAAAAEALCGAPFRLHGRNPATGIDCVGVVVAALGACGRAGTVPRGYALRTLTVEPLLRCAGENGFVPAPPGRRSRGDLAMVLTGPAQHHLVIAVDSASVVHAHAGLRRTARQAWDPAWQELHRWRLTSFAQG